MVKGPGYPEWQYRTLAIDVQGMSPRLSSKRSRLRAHYLEGQPRLYLENADAFQEKKRPGFKMLGIQWR